MWRYKNTHPCFTAKGPNLTVYFKKLADAEKSKWQDAMAAYNVSTS